MRRCPLLSAFSFFGFTRRVSSLVRFSNRSWRRPASLSLARFTNSYTSGMESLVCRYVCVCFGQGYNGKGNNWHWQLYDVKDNRDDSIFCDPQCPFTRFSLLSLSRPLLLPLVWVFGHFSVCCLCCQLVVFKMTLKTAK